MLTSEERIKAIHKKAAEIETAKRHTQQTVIKVGSVLASLAAIVFLALYIPGVANGISAEHANSGMRASLLSGTGALGYIAIGVIAFLLGCFATAFCVKLKKWRDDTAKESNRGKEE